MKSLNRDEGNICFNILTMSRNINQSFVTVNPYTNNDIYTRMLKELLNTRKKGRKKGKRNILILEKQGRILERKK